MAQTFSIARFCQSTHTQIQWRKHSPSQGSANQCTHRYNGANILHRKVLPINAHTDIMAQTFSIARFCQSMHTDIMAQTFSIARFCQSTHTQIQWRKHSPSQGSANQCTHRYNGANILRRKVLPINAHRYNGANILRRKVLPINAHTDIMAQTFSIARFCQSTHTQI